MKGTTTSVKEAMRLTPPKMIMPSMIASTAAVVLGWMSMAFCKLEPMELAWTPGSSRPQAKMVTMAKVTAYHFMPRPFSM
ncbi:hypothetical protein D3C86_1812820 [compost metagenome]